MSPSLSRNDLEEFQKSLLMKINGRLYNDRELEMIPEEQIIPTTSNNHLEELDIVSTNSISQNNLNSLGLVRSRSNSSNFSSSGYLFLAIMFCMMCCSSLFVNPTSLMKFSEQTQSFSKVMNSFEGRKLMFSATERPKESKSQTLSAPLDDDIVMIDV